MAFELVTKFRSHPGIVVLREYFYSPSAWVLVGVSIHFFLLVLRAHSLWDAVCRESIVSGRTEQHRDDVTHMDQWSDKDPEWRNCDTKWNFLFFLHFAAPCNEPDVPMWSKQTPYSRMAPICPKIWSPRCRYTRQPRPSPAAMVLLIGPTDRGMLSSGPSHITSSHIPACGDIWWRGTYRGWLPFQPAMLKWKHPHQRAWNQSQRLPVILVFPHDPTLVRGK